MAAPFKRSRFKKKQCSLCKNKIKEIDYKNIDLFKRYINNKGSISPSRITGTCAKHQRKIAQAVKRARQIALLSYESTGE